MFDAYAAQILDYYTHRVDPKTDNPGSEYAQEWDREFSVEGPLRDLATQMKQVLAGRDVLEIASGLGRWTRPLLATANSVLATDASPRCLSRLNDGASFGLEFAAGSISCAEDECVSPR